MRFMYYVNGIITTRFNASLALANCYGGDPEMLIVNAENNAEIYLVQTGDALWLDYPSGVAISWA